MAVDLSMKSDRNNNAVDLSLRTQNIPQLSLTKDVSSEATLKIVERLMEARASTHGLSDDNKATLDMTALNLLCLARLQEMLQPPLHSLQPPAISLSASTTPVPPVSHIRSSPCNRKIFKCDYENCTKVRLRRNQSM